MLFLVSSANKHRHPIEREKNNFLFTTINQIATNEQWMGKNNAVNAAAAASRP